MAIALTAPGVYVEELPSGTRTISGVSTSLAAFVGRALCGPLNEPTRIFSFDEFERRFGGLWVKSPMSQAVRHFFQNGGSDALIVRVVNGGTAAESAAKAVAVLPGTVGGLSLRATAAALALGGFDHLRLVVSATGATTFDLLVEARSADGAILSDGAVGSYEYTVAVDLAGNVATTLAAAATSTVTPITLVQLTGLAPSALPDDGEALTTPVGATHRATLSATAGGSMVLQATPAATLLENFHHLALTVTGTSATKFDLEVEARDIDGAALSEGGIVYGYTVAVDLTLDVAGTLAAAATPHATPVTLVALSGAAMTSAPDDGAMLTAPTGGTRDVTLATTASLGLEARDEGTWGNSLRAAVSTTDAPTGAFHLTIEEVDEDGNPIADEVFYNLTLGSGDVRSIERVLELESQLVRVSGTVPVVIPDPTIDAAVFDGGDDGDDPRITQDVQGSEAEKTGVYALLKADLFNLLCIPLSSWATTNPGEVALWQNAATFCEDRRAFLIIDPPSDWSTFALAQAGAPDFTPRSRNAALYFPRLRISDPLQEGRLDDFAPCGVVAGVIARTDGQRAVWKAPAGTDATCAGVADLEVSLTDPQQGVLNQLGINCVRRFPVFGTVVWGARTLDGADVVASEWKYIPVRRLALFLEESLYRGSRWAVFEPNDEGLWAQLRLNIGSFMHQLFRQGAFQGKSAREAYFVKCDAATTTQNDIDRGIVNVIIGFAPLKPAEFVIIKIQQLAEQASA